MLNILKIFCKYLHLIFVLIINSQSVNPIFHIAISDKEFETDISKFQIIDNPMNCYLADPFIITKDNVNYIFLENYDIKTNLGQIKAYEIDSGLNLIDHGVVIIGDFHVSFPYLFQYKDEYFMVPETKTQNEVAIYKNTIWPNKWEKYSTPLSGKKAVDSVIFKNGTNWWLITTFDSAGMNLAQSELHVFYSDNLMKDNWTKHPENPVVVNSYFGRNAGLFLHDGRYIRCSQSMKEFKYGVQTNYHEINLINESNYSETLINDLTLKNSHTFDTKNNISTIDLRL